MKVKFTTNLKKETVERLTHERQTYGMLMGPTIDIALEQFWERLKKVRTKELEAKIINSELSHVGRNQTIRGGDQGRHKAPSPHTSPIQDFKRY